MKKPKEFVSSARKEIEAELLRLMKDPKCYAISTSEIECEFMPRDRILIRHSPWLWSSYYTLNGMNRLIERSCFAAKRSRLFKHVAAHASYNSYGERTLIVGWFA